MPCDVAETVTAIRHLHRRREFAMAVRMRADLALGAFVRTSLGWSTALPAAERARIAAQAEALVAVGERVLKQAARPADKRKPVPEADSEDYRDWAEIIEAALAARAPFAVIEKRSGREMARLARGLPVWPWAEGVRGLSDLRLAVIVGEAGDLSAYPDHSKLWKRMGVAVIDGVRQGGMRRGASDADWVRHGYDRSRRARLFVIGGCLIKAGGESRYYAAYRARKAYERERAEARGLTVAPAAQIPKGRADEFMSLGHIDRRARRYMEKKLLRDLWREWRRAEGDIPETAEESMPAATPATGAADGAGRANAAMPETAEREMPAPAPPDPPQRATLDVPATASQSLPAAADTR